MFRFSRLLCGITLFSAVGIAMGAAVKIKGFDTSYGMESSDADGMAILNYVQGQDETKVQIIMSGFTPNTNYLFTFQSDSHCMAPGGGLITDEHGHATFHGEIPNLSAFGDCGGGDWSDSDIVFTTESDEGPVHAVAWNPS